MIDLISRRKMVPSRPSSFAGPGKNAPNAMPATSAIRIQVVSDGRFICLPHFSFSRSTSKNSISGGRIRLMRVLASGGRRRGRRSIAGVRRPGRRWSGRWCVVAAIDHLNHALIGRQSRDDW